MSNRLSPAAWSVALAVALSICACSEGDERTSSGGASTPGTGGASTPSTQAGGSVAVSGGTRATTDVGATTLIATTVAAGGTNAAGGQSSATTGGAASGGMPTSIAAGGYAVTGGAATTSVGVTTGGITSVTSVGGSTSTGGTATTGGTRTAVGFGGSSAVGGMITTGGTIATGGKAASGGRSNTGGTHQSTGGTWSTGGHSAASTGGAKQTGLEWPIDCVLGQTCSIGYPDIDGDGVAFNCEAPGYTGHQGTDIGITWEMMDAGTDVFAAADGQVLWVFDGHYDRCPNDTEASCQAPSLAANPGVESGYMVCTGASDQYCQGTSYTTGCFWCFYGSNVVVIRHPSGVFATRYDHLRRNSIVVTPGQQVMRGQKIAQAGSAGNSSGPHLHFEVWVGGFYQLADPWAGKCGPNTGPSLWDPALGLN